MTAVDLSDSTGNAIEICGHPGQDDDILDDCQTILTRQAFLLWRLAAADF
jgi:hypothetical protein